METGLIRRVSEGLLALPVLLGTLVLLGWLSSRKTLWMHWGLMTLGIGLFCLTVSLLLWAIQFFHPELESPRPWWRLPALALAALLLAALYFGIAMQFQPLSRITLTNTTGLVVDKLQTLNSCEPEFAATSSLPPGQKLSFDCQVRQEGPLQLQWQAEGKPQTLKQGYLSPNMGGDLQFDLDDGNQPVLP